MLRCYGALLDHKQVSKIRVLWDVTPCSAIGRNILANFIPLYMELTMTMVAEICLGGWYVSAKHMALLFMRRYS
jgi:hypothetical protein